MDIFLITSIIKISTHHLANNVNRSVFNHQQRFEQTKQTIKSIRDKLPNIKIMLVECSPFNEEEKQYFIENTDYFYNIYDTEHEENKNTIINSLSKAKCEGTMTIEAIDYLLQNNIDFHHFYKISGRYWLNENFDSNFYINHSNVCKMIHNNRGNCATCLYKLSKENTMKWYNYLLQNNNELNIYYIGYENHFAFFLQQIHFQEYIHERLGVSGNVSICGTLIHE